MREPSTDHVQRPIERLGHVLRELAGLARILPVLVAGALVLAAGGCIGIDEEVALDATGRARYTVDITMLEFVIQGLAEMTGEDASKGIGAQWMAQADSSMRDSIRLREFVDTKDHHFVGERDFVSLEHLGALSARASFPDTAGSGPDSGPDPGSGRKMEMPLPGIQVTRLDGGRFRVRRVLEPPTAGAMPGAPDTADARAQRMFKDRSYVFRLRAPRVESANGTIAPDRRSVEWRVPLLGLGENAVVPEAVLSRSAGR